MSGGSEKKDDFRVLGCKSVVSCNLEYLSYFLVGGDAQQKINIHFAVLEK